MPTLLFTHPDFLLCAKPAGLSFHDEGGELGFVNVLREQLRRQADTQALAASLHPVHRLDRMTSGLVLLARHETAARQLGELFAQGGMEKYYVALSARAPSKKQGWVKGAMSKGRNGAWRLVDKAAEPDAPWAVTQFFSYGLGKVAEADEQTLRLFLVRPRTGRTHQIRVALKSVGSPILGDVRYGGTPACAADERGYLHAYALRFVWQSVPFEYAYAPQHSTGAVWHSAAVAQALAHIAAPWQLAWPQP